MVSHWTVWANTTSEKAARKVHGWIQRRLERESEHLSLEPYRSIKGCWDISFQITLTGTAWNDAVVEVIGLGQRIGRGWILAGDVYAEIDGWSNEPSVSGVRSMHWNLASQPPTFTFEADVDYPHDESFQTDTEFAREKHLLCDVMQKAARQARWETVTAGLEDLGVALALAKTIEAYESGVFVKFPNVGGFVYWTSRDPDVFNHAVIGMRLAKGPTTSGEPL